MGKFRQIFTELSACDTIMAGYYSLTFLFFLQIVDEAFIVQTSGTEGDPCKLLIVMSLLGPVVQSVVSLTSSLRVILLTVLGESIHNILIFFAEKM